MKQTIIIVSITCLLIFSGCAQLEFKDDGLKYYDPKPYLLVSITVNCVTTATMVMIPAQETIVKLKPGIGSNNLSVSLKDGMISSVGQQTDTKIPETISAIASLRTAGIAHPTPPEGCIPSAILYPIENGVPNLQKPIRFPVEPKQ